MSIHSETQVVDFRGELPEKKKMLVYFLKVSYISKLGSSLGTSDILTAVTIRSIIGYSWKASRFWDRQQRTDWCGSWR